MFVRIWNRLWIVVVVLGLLALPAAAETDWSHFSAGWVYVTASFTTDTGQFVTYRESFRVLPNFDTDHVEITDFEAGVRIILTPNDAFRLAEGLRHLAGTPQGNQRQDRGQQWSAFTWTDAAGSIHGWLEFQVFERVPGVDDAADAEETVYEVYLPVDAMMPWAEALDQARGAWD